MKTLVLGIGNPILSDDSAGLRVVRALEGKVNQEEVTLLETSLAGLNLFDLLVDHDRAIIVDAVQIKDGEVGQVYRLDPKQFDDSRIAISSHSISFVSVLELGKRLGLAMPQEVIIFGIQVEDTSTFSEDCTPQVCDAIEIAAEMVVNELKSPSC